MAKARCMYKYNKQTKSWGYASKGGSHCTPHGATAKKHSKIAAGGMGGLQGYFGRLRAKRAAARKGPSKMPMSGAGAKYSKSFSSMLGRNKRAASRSAKQEARYAKYKMAGGMM